MGEPSRGRLRRILRRSRRQSKDGENPYAAHLPRGRRQRTGVSRKFDQFTGDLLSSRWLGQATGHIARVAGAHSDQIQSASLIARAVARFAYALNHQLVADRTKPMVARDSFEHAVELFADKLDHLTAFFAKQVLVAWVSVIVLVGGASAKAELPQ